ncbi:MAG TPA: hypothetical protein VKQ32_01930 [Polyangia bacterium]|nr:hypothetical protein [Polyangia bacterium]
MAGESSSARVSGRHHRSSIGTRPRSGEFFAPLPLAALALIVVNDVWLKPAFHSALTGKLSDIALCFFMPLFVSELLGILFGVSPRARLAVGALITTALYTAQEIVPPFTRFALAVLGAVGPHLGIHRAFRLTSDWTDLFCLALVPAAVWYGRWRLERIRPEPAPATDGCRTVADAH